MDGFLHGNIWSKGFGGKSIFTSEPEVYTVFKVEYFLDIIQIMLQYTPSFNKVCYTLNVYKTKYYASAGGYVTHLCARLGGTFIYICMKDSCSATL